MYSKEFEKSLKAVEAAREDNIALEPRRMTADEKDALLAAYHPDYKKSEFSTLKIGPNKGEQVPHELCEMLEAHSRIKADDVDLNDVTYDVDVLIIGGGGAGASAAIEADNAGAKTMIVTKLRIGDANTMMAEGGIQAADKPNDSPAIHFVDAFGGGHFAAKRELLSKLVCDAPEAIKWLNELGVEFDKTPDGTMVTTHGGGTSRKRMHAAKDYSGAEIMRTLRDEVLNRGIPVVDFTSAIELILDENGNAAGAVLMNMETKELMVARAKTVIIATGGAGRMHYQGFPTSNHYGATADGLVLAYRVGSKLLYADTLQYHPTGAALEDQQLLQGAVTPDAVKRSQIRRPGRGLLLPERGLRPQKPGEKGGQGPDRRPVGLFSQLRRLTCFPQAVRPVQNRCKCHCGGCRFRLHLLQKGQDHVLLRDRLSRARPVQQGPCRRLRCLLQHLYSHHLPGGLRDRPLPLGTPQQGDHCHQ